MESVEEEQSVRAVVWVHDSVEKCVCIYTMVAISASHPEAELVRTGTSLSACKVSIACVPQCRVRVAAQEWQTALLI